MNEDTRLYRRLRHYRLSPLIRLIGSLSRQMFLQQQPHFTVSAVRHDRLVAVEGKVGISAWGLCNLAYLAVCATNDFNGKTPNQNDLISLINEWHGYDGDESRTVIEDVSSDEFVVRTIVGHSQKQFWYQQSWRIAAEFNRQVEILESIPARSARGQEFDAISIQRTGLKLSEFRAVLMALMAIQSPDITSFQPTLGLDRLHPALSSANLAKVVSYYSADYRQIRKSPLLETHFLAKPVVRTSTNELLVPDAFLLAKKVADGPLWLLKDHYREHGSHEFVNEFGDFFEEYLRRLFEFAVPNKDFSRVAQPRSGRSADWIVFSPKFRVLVEQKSATPAIMIKRLYPEMKPIAQIIERLAEAILQLDETEARDPDHDRETVKIVVHYEPYFVSDGLLRPRALESVRHLVRSDRNVFFCDIDDFELLFSVLERSVETYERILALKIETQHDPNRGIEFSQLIQEITDLPNVFNQKQLGHWHSYLPGLRDHVDQRRSAT